MADTRGFDPSHIDYLVGHAQQMHAPDDFHNEVQKHLDNWETSDDVSGQHEEAQDQAIANVADFGNPPVIPSAPKKMPSPPSL